MKIMLIYADNIVEQRPVSNNPHMEIIAAMLKDHKIYSLYNISQEEVLSKIQEIKPEYIGVLINTTEHMGKVLKMVQEFRDVSENSVIIAYGVYCAFWSEYLSSMHNGLIDYVIEGEPEISFFNIVSYRKYEKCRETQIVKENKPQDLDSLPNQIIRSASDLNTMVARGCFNRCLFCCERPFYGEFRYRSVENVIAELKSFYIPNSNQWVYFSDLDFLALDAVNKEWFNKFAEQIQNEDIHIQFTIQTRANRIVNNQKLLQKLYKIGLRGIALGIESGSKRVLNVFNKNSEDVVNREAIEVLKKLKIPFKINYIMFEPTTTLADIHDNINFLESVNFPEGTYASQPPASASSELRIILNSEAYHYFSHFNINLRVENGYLRYDFENEEVRDYYKKIEKWKKDTSFFYGQYSYCLNYTLNSKSEDFNLLVMGNKFKRIDLEVMKLLIENEYDNIILPWLDKVKNLQVRLEKWMKANPEARNVKMKTRGWHINYEYLFDPN